MVPLFVTILMFSMYFTELIRMKLRLQEVSRYVAWEMTSYALNDYGSNGKPDNKGAFDEAMKKTIDEASERYKDLDSIEDNQPNSFIAKNGPVTIKMTSLEAPILDTSVAPGAVQGALSSLSSGVGTVFGLWGFNKDGKVQVDVESQFQSIFMKKQFLERDKGGFYSVDQFGNRSIEKFNLKNRYTLVANSWYLPDGADATIKGKRAGVHNGGSDSGLYRQVNRMTFLGLKNLADSAPVIGQVKKFMDKLLPAFLGTFVVSHNYTTEGNIRNCNNNQFNQRGQNNLDKYPGVDDDRLKCFDTVPFRDTYAWKNSLYAQAFEARGNHFMGCKNEQADAPNTPAPGLEQVGAG